MAAAEGCIGEQAGLLQQGALTYVSPGHLHRGVPVDVGQQAKAEALRVGGIGEAVHRQRGLRCVKGLAHPLVQLIVGDGAPEGRLRVGDGLQVCTGRSDQTPSLGSESTASYRSDSS